jgi:glycosyltransferase involved in cell wall biosynthesis
VKKHVAFVLAGIGAGGAERVVALLSAMVIERGWRATIISFDRPDAASYHAFHPDIGFVFLPGNAGRPRTGMARTLKRLSALRAALAGGQFQLIVSFLTKINTLTLLAATGLGVPVIVSERNNPLRQRTNPAWRWLLALLYKRAAAIVLQTDRSRKCLPPAQRSRAHVIPNPIALPPAVPPPLDRQITAVGRLTEQKGFDLLIDAFARIAPLHPDWRLVIWGDGPLRAWLTERIADHGLEHRIMLPGLSPSHGAWINPGEIFVLSSRYEGFPNVLAEAMTAGMAPVAFDCEFGPSELIDHGHSGLLVPPENTVALAVALNRLIQSPELRGTLAYGAAQSATRYDCHSIGQSWLTLLDNLDR